MAFSNKGYWAVAALAISAAACGGEQSAPPAAAAAGVAVAEAVAPTATAAAPATGNVIEVKMTMANGAARFEPAAVTARAGDVIRFVNVDNVHNISFPQDKNAAASGLPAPSPYLTNPGQTYDLTVDLQPGTYTYQCDPHVAMGMVGQLTVVQ